MRAETPEPFHSEGRMEFLAQIESIQSLEVYLNVERKLFNSTILRIAPHYGPGNGIGLSSKKKTLELTQVSTL